MYTKCHNWCKNFFDQPAKGNLRTYDNIQKIVADEGDYYTTACLLDYAYFKENCKSVAVDLSKHQALHADPKQIQQINFPGNLNRPAITMIFFIIKETKEIISSFWQGTTRVVKHRMNQCNTLNLNLSNSELNRLKSKSGIRNGTEVILDLSSNVISDSNDKINFTLKLLLTDTQVSRIRKAFTNNSSTNIKLSKTQLSKMVQSGGFIKYTADVVLRKIQKESPILAKDATEYFVGKKINELGKKLQKVNF